MKHLFYIHSYITYIVSMSVVKELALNGSDVVFLYGRGFTYSDESTPTVAHLPPTIMALSKVPTYGSPLLMIRMHREITAFDHLISCLVGTEPFIGYLPLTKNFLMQLIATHQLCADVSYIEEGLLSYTGKVRKQTYAYFTDSWRGRIARGLRYPNHGNRSLYYRDYPHSLPATMYMIHAPHTDMSDELRIQVLSTIEVPMLEDRYIARGGHLFIVETVVEDRITSMQSYVQTLDSFVEMWPIDGSSRVWIRFRPGTPPSPDILSVFTSRSVEASIIPDDVCVESMLYRSEEMTIVGLSSSLLFYGAIWGHQSISLLPTLFKFDEMAERRYQEYAQIPADFLQRVVMR